MSPVPRAPMVNLTVSLVSPIRVRVPAGFENFSHISVTGIKPERVKTVLSIIHRLDRQNPDPTLSRHYKLEIVDGLATPGSLCNQMGEGMTPSLSLFFNRKKQEIVAMRWTRRLDKTLKNPRETSLGVAYVLTGAIRKFVRV